MDANLLYKIFGWTLFFVTTAALIFGLKYSIKHKHRSVLKVFPFYSLFSIVELTISAFNIPNLFFIIRNWFPLLELLVFFIFFNSVLSTKWVKMLLPFLFLIFLSDCIVLSIDSPNPEKFNLGNAYTVESLLLILPAAFYFKETFQSRSDVILSTDTSFWLTTGISVFALSSIPLSSFQWVFSSQMNEKWLLILVPVIALPYIIMNILFIKGFTCKMKILQL